MPIPDELIELLKQREGVKYMSYRDSLHVPTGGVGHALSPSELAEYPIGSPIPEEVVNQWLQQDAAWAYSAGQSQARQIGLNDARLVNALADVSFQMGPKWYLPKSVGGKGFVGTWRLLKAHQWAEAANEAGESAWAKETEIRYEDFKKVLLTLAEEQEQPAASSMQPAAPLAVAANGEQTGAAA